LTVTVLAFCVIRILDLISDDERTDETFDEAIFQVIRAIALLVGFAWEQAFDEAVLVLGSTTPFPHTSKFALAMTSILIIMPAWYHYILPMAVTQQWEWGFLVDLETPSEEQKWKKVLKHIREHFGELQQRELDAGDEATKRDRKSLAAHFGNIAQTLHSPSPAVLPSSIPEDADGQLEIPYVRLQDAPKASAQTNAKLEAEVQAQKETIDNLETQVADLHKALEASMDSLATQQRGEEERTRVLESQLAGVEGMATSLANANPQ